MRGGGLRIFGVVLLACSVLTGLGFLLKAPCMGDYEDNRNRYLCVNDIQVLYVNRGMTTASSPTFMATWSVETFPPHRSRYFVGGHAGWDRWSEDYPARDEVIGFVSAEDVAVLWMGFDRFYG